MLKRVPFGKIDVEATEKSGLVQGVFSQVADRYDFMNDVMALGVHRLWRRVLIDRLRVYSKMRLLDVAGGTGDITYRAIRAGCERVVVVDFSREMIEIGKKRLLEKGLVGEIEWIHASAEDMPIDSLSMDVCTIAFGLRNLVDIDRSLSEMSRVLRPGGRMLCLEFSHPPSKFLENVFGLYNKSVLPKMGKFFLGDGSPYDYLAESIDRHPGADEISERMIGVGFENVSYERLSGGIVAIHSGWKI